MSDFETHARGTAEEIRLSRKLFTVITQLQEQWGDNILPVEIRRAHAELENCYMKQLESEQQ